MQESRHARIPACFLIHAEGLRQRHHQCTDGNGVHIGVIVTLFQARQADQCFRVACDRFRDLRHQRQACMHVNRVAKARFVEHRLRGDAGLPTQRRSMLQFLPERDAPDQRSVRS